jgi:hypothetical protein
MWIYAVGTLLTNEALPRPLPAPHQHGHFLVAADERRELAGT